MNSSTIAHTPGANTSHAGSGNTCVRFCIPFCGVVMVCSLASHLAEPRAMSMVPSVMMNGTILRYDVSDPATKPQTAQTAMAANAAISVWPPVTCIAAASEISAGRNAFSTTATTTVPSAIWEPTLRSMPPEMITNVMPSAAMPTMTVWVRMVRILSNEENEDGDRMTKSRKTKTSPKSGANWERILFMDYPKK